MTRATGTAGADSLPYLIGHLDDAGSGRRMPSFSLEMARPYRIPKDGEFLALNLAAFTTTKTPKSANDDIEIVDRVSAAAAFLAARYGARVRSRIGYNGQRVWSRPMESLTDVLGFIVRTSGITRTILGGALLGSQLNVLVDTDAGTMRLVKIDAKTSATTRPRFGAAPIGR